MFDLFELKIMPFLKPPSLKVKGKSVNSLGSRAIRLLKQLLNSAFAGQKHLWTISKWMDVTMFQQNFIYNR